jgi:predicted dehydrogenase
MHDTHDRRTFLKAAAATGIGVALEPDTLRALEHHVAINERRPLANVRIGLVGIGNQGRGHLRNFLALEGCSVDAVCDLLPERVTRAQATVKEAGKPEPRGYSGPNGYRELCASDLDLVYTVTPWELHAPVCREAMRNGKHAATEIPIAVTVDDCWELVELSEKTGLSCVMMENCCYDRTELMILNLVRRQVLGELTHAECGYLHDLRALKLSPDYYVNRWRLAHSVRRNGDLYPTHGLGPVAQWLNVNRGNRFDYLVSIATPAHGLNLWAAEHIGPESIEAKQKYALGDVVNTLIKTMSGQTILVTHDTNSPRPYSRRVMLQGTKGLVQKYPDERIHIEGRSPEHQWEQLATYRAEFEHPLWAAIAERAREGGHGGMDYIEDYRLITCLGAGAPTDMDVYDGAALSCVSELSERSIQRGSAPMKIPDFTRGAWQKRAPLGIITI